MAHASETEAATQRMHRRREAIRAANEQFEALPTSNQEILRYGFQLAEDEARTVVHRGRSDEPLSA